MRLVGCYMFEDFIFLMCSKSERVLEILSEMKYGNVRILCLGSIGLVLFALLGCRGLSVATSCVFLLI